MSLSVNLSIVINGLIFNMDAGNIKSVSAPTTKNIATSITPRGIGDNGTTYRFTSGIENVYIPTVGWINSNYVDMYNDYNGGSGNCCPSPYGYGDSIPVTGSTLYTYAILYKSINRYTNANWMYHYEFGASGYITEYGVHMVGGHSGQETHLGDDWYWSRAKFTTNANATTINTGSWMYQYATYNRLYVAKILIAPGDWTGLHPSQWPALNTVSTTVNDLSGFGANGTITNASQSTTTNPSAVTLNGINQYIRTNHANYSSAWSPNGVNGNTSMTVEVVLKTSDSGFIVSREWNGGGQYNYTMTNDSFGLHANATGYSVGYSSIATGSPVHMVWWMTPSQMGVYRNGQVYVSATSHGLSGSGGSSGSQSGGTSFGTLYPYGEGWGGNTGFSLAGDYYIARMYNRLLSASEVTQNFNAIRGRYGL